jgi:predicted transcriptional regulator
MLKRLFTSNTRIKLLTLFLLKPDEEFFIRELTRKLSEQINSVRRELDNLKKTGFLKSKTKNRKKYYYANKDFIFLEELKSIFLKALSSNDNIAEEVKKMGDIRLLVLSGLFVEQPTKTVDMLIVGEVDKNRLTEYLNNEVRTARPVKFSIITEEDYKYRLSCNDKFTTEITNDPTNQVLVKNL